MPVTIKKSAVFLVLSAVFFNSGCSYQKPALNQVYSTFENVAAAEKGFENQQEQLITLEKQQNASYEKIIGLGIKQSGQINTIADEAIRNIKERKNDLDKETESLRQSEKSLQKIAYLKNNISNQKLKKIINELYNIMEKRYQAYDVLVKEYQIGLRNEKQLYFMFKHSLPIPKIQLQVDKINNTYDKIYSANQSFNQYTEEYNAKKLLFDQEAGLKAVK